MDPLSDVLALLRVQSVLSARMEGRGHWALRFPSYRHMKFGGVLQGSRWLWVEGGTPVRLAAGDFYLLTDGRPYCVASDPDLAPEDGVAVFSSHMGTDGIVRYGDVGELNVVAAGRFTFHDDVGAQALLRLLPPVVHIPAGGAFNAPLAALLPLVAMETVASAPGANVAAASLANLVLVQILRAHLASAHQPPGWLGAMADASIGRALSMMHGDVGRRWTVDDLARAIGMSRTAFSTRFRERVGLPPLDYLTRWRMTLAADALRTGDASLMAIAERVGYASDTAFSNAFKRERGVSPGRFRALEADHRTREDGNRAG
ncbi:AraC family transcriptional regulator [Roseateles sp. SL47]|uniref:AraC family transcriptional regulator n=1 Tax=Roseateles sp. SL47 TaxID=2995138 RepID=UPI00226D490A|nr:AraC family transcriptional regulator [Roseateles sp. SL47]WAC70909.1 AraC family transcriptional regulator [Roseateles sp. SL47]